ncbi:hypothetical protein EAM_1067 [Erwinia amylovora ATCC 49946]|nr:hypothetical protein EAM_1067 [Erwinia amylovora ATCC 49946]CCO77910.1 hypothetical protein BN432_1089 [Erwinia amylovora Ea356]CCO81697.1 hypothetical protein BN433_1103 [Erwinia amylovora Ea266]CCO85501.1 hypothetical protein BN434_1090 [Erwinia amylovora CFBP 2585]
MINRVSDKYLSSLFRDKLPELTTCELEKFSLKSDDIL